MLNLKKHSEQDIESLIESMLRLIEYMNNNPGIKRQIFESFNQEDLQKILKNLNDKQNVFLRKVSCVFLCTVLQNEENCESFIRLNELLPVNSKIAINGIPEKLGKYITSDILQKLHSVHPLENRLCWYYTYQMAKDQLANLAYFQLNLKDLRKSISEFVDPYETMIGITYRKSYIRGISPEQQNWSIKNEQPRMSISPVSKQMCQILPLKEIDNPKYYKRYQVKSMNQQQYKVLVSNTMRTDTSMDQSPPQSDLIKNRLSDNNRAVRSALQPNQKKKQSDAMQIKNPQFRYNN